MKTVIYLAGGMGKFGKENFRESNQWRVELSKMLSPEPYTKLVQTINPNDYFNFYDNIPAYESDREVMEFDLHKVKKSDLIIVNFNDPYSLGTMAEMSLAYELKKPILGLCEDADKNELHPWQKCMCNRIFNNKDNLVEYVWDFYVD